MCRNIKTLFNFEPPATELEIRDAALQFVRKLSGFTHPSAKPRSMIAWQASTSRLPSIGLRSVLGGASRS